MSISSEIRGPLCVDSGRRRNGCRTKSILGIIARYPRLIHCGMMCHPRKSCMLLRHTDPETLELLLEAVPTPIVLRLLLHCLDNVSRQLFFERLIPLMNTPDVHDAMSVLLSRVEPEYAVLIINSVELEQLTAVLRAPAEKLAAVIESVDRRLIATAVLPMLQQPEPMLRLYLVPLLRDLEYPEHLGVFLASVSTDVLLWSLYHVEPRRLAALLNGLGPEALGPDSAAVICMQAAAADPVLAEEKLLPLLSHGDPAFLAVFLRDVPPERLLPVLESVDSEDMIRLMDTVNPEVAVRLFAGPTQHIMDLVAGQVAMATRNPLMAGAMHLGSNVLGAGFDVVDRGKQARGASKDDSYQFGDLSRGMLTSLSMAAVRVESDSG